MKKRKIKHTNKLSSNGFFMKMITAIMLAAAITDGFAASPVIIDQQKIIADLKQHSSLRPVIFPAKVSAASVPRLYMSASSYGIKPDYNQFWQLNVDATPECHGVRVCNIGFISAEKNGKLSLRYHSLPNNKDHLKQQVKLQNNIIGYYTPFHVEAGGVNPTLEWKINQVLFTLSWQIQAGSTQQKQILTAMANSTISTHRSQ